MTDSPNPTARRIALGAKIKQLREDAGLSRQDMAAELEWSLSKVTRVHLGQVGVSRSDVLNMARLFGRSEDTELVEHLLELARESRTKGWWAGYDPPNPVYYGLESDALLVQDWAPLVVPGLLQTRGYAEHMVAAAKPHLSESKRQQQVELRMRRQDRVFRGDLRLMTVIDEAVLTRRVGGPDVMLVQMERLYEASVHPNVTLHVSPLVAQEPAVHGAFTILTLSTGAELVFAEGVGGDVILDDPAEVGDLNSWHARRISQSEGVNATRHLIKETITRYASESNRR
jgi:transcriptional regulator with XRE-family HTH domain